MFSKILTGKSTSDCSCLVNKLYAAIAEADTIIIGAGYYESCIVGSEGNQIEITV